MSSRETHGTRAGRVANPIPAPSYFKLPKTECSTDHMPIWKKRKPIAKSKGEKLGTPEWTKNDHVQDGG